MPTTSVSGAEHPEPAATVRVEADGAVVEAWREHHDELFGFLRASTHDDAAAEDLLQDAFLRLTAEARAGRMPELVRPWLFRVAANLAISRVRRRSTAFRWLQQQLDPASRTSESPEARTVRNEAAADIVGSLATLGPDARTALLLAGDGFSGEEIAAAIGRTEGATRTLMSRARLQLRTERAIEAQR